MLSVLLRHKFPGFDLDATFKTGQGITALFGRSGSGKTTIVNAIAGLLRPEEGRIVVNDHVLLDTAKNRWLPPHVRGIGYVFQDDRLFPHLTVRRNLLYGRHFQGLRGDGQLASLVELLGIGALLERRPRALSGGERQRVAIGRAIMSNPRLLLMDEPLAALDDARKAEIMPYLERLRDVDNLPILYVTHSPAEIARLANSAVLLEAGRVIASGSAGKILSDPATAPVLGMRETGAIITARITAHEDDGLTKLQLPCGQLFLSRVDAAIGAVVRLRILAQDVMIAVSRPTEISALNVLPVIIQDLTHSADSVLVRLGCGDETLLARITHRSATALKLRTGLHVHAVLKAVTIAQGAIGLEPRNKIGAG